MKLLNLLPLLTLATIFDYSCSELTLDILHINDIHARFEQTNVYSGKCVPIDEENNNCYGGFARISSKVKELRSSLDNTLFLSAGDFFQGTIWYTIHKWRPFAYFLNLMEHDVMALGNHEFDDGISGIVPFLENVTFPVVASNIDDSDVPSFQGKVSPSVVITKNGTQIGIVGYLTTVTAEISYSEDLKILDEVESVRREARVLREQGINIIIALGHAGFTIDQDIARNVEEVDIVVGGHTNTFLNTGDDPSTETSVGEYPTVVTQDSGRKVLVVQAYAFGKYLGHLQVTFDEAGEVSNWNGNPILLDSSVPQDPVILEELKPWKDEVDEVSGQSIGRTFVFLDGNRFSCQMKECNMGNLITDSMIHQNAKYPDDEKWAHTALAVLHSGGISASIDERSYNGSMNMGDILMVLPFEDTIDIVELQGKHVKEMFERSVRDYDLKGVDPPGDFLQVSGFRIVFDVTKPPGSRVVNIEVRCLACRIPEFEPLDSQKLYRIAMPAYLAKGGGEFSVISENKVAHHVTGLLDSDILIQYIELMSPIYQGIENRIKFLDPKEPCANMNCFSTAGSQESSTEVRPQTGDEITIERETRVENPANVYEIVRQNQEIPMKASSGFVNWQVQNFNVLMGIVTIYFLSLMLIK